MVSERRAFGERARRQRERRGVTLEKIAQSTKVPASLFAGLERGDCSRWPAGLYSRAYIRAYAELIGLDPNEAVEDFTAAFGETVLAGRRAHPASALSAAADLQALDGRSARPAAPARGPARDHRPRRPLVRLPPSSGSHTPSSRHRSGRPSAWPSPTRLAEGCSPIKRSSAGRRRLARDTRSGS